MFDTVQENQSQDSNTFNWIAFSDELDEFSDYCCFLCDAYALIVTRSEDEVIGERTISGIRRSANWMKERLEEINAKFRKAQEQSCVERNEEKGTK